MAESDRRKWDARYRERRGPLSPPCPFLVSLDAILPRQGRALDVAGGDGRNALWLAQRGLDVTLTDISDVALGLARQHADAAGCSLHTQLRDLEVEGLPAGPWALIVCCHFLWRPLFEPISATLERNGLLVVVHPTRSNLQRHERPGPAYLLEDGEIPRLVEGLEIVRYDEGWTDEGRHLARLVARRA